MEYKSGSASPSAHNHSPTQVYYEIEAYKQKLDEIVWQYD